jgi:translation initiation factor 6 (eIF-6)
MPSTTTDQELLHTRNSLPDDVVVQRVDESEPVAAACQRPITCSRCLLHQFLSDSSHCNATSGLSALGNCIACNDYVALVHTDIDKVRAKKGCSCAQNFAELVASDLCGLLFLAAGDRGADRRHPGGA